MSRDKQKIDRVRLDNYREEKETGTVVSWNRAAENLANAADNLGVKYDMRKDH